MRLGLLARADNTGLGRMSDDAVRHLKPSQVVIVDVRHPHGVSYRDWDTIVDFIEVADPQTSAFQDAVHRMLENIDVLLILETPYDSNVYGWAWQFDVRTVCVAMPEYNIPSRWRADRVVNPTPYLNDRLPNALINPWPVDTLNYTPRVRYSANTFLHVVGQPCANDRNGTDLVYQAFRRLPHRNVIFRSQVQLDYRPYSNMDFRVGNVVHPAELYTEGDVFLSLRRYAGQNLPAMEAMASGLPLVCLDREPDNRWTHPSAIIPAYVRREWAVRNRSTRDARSMRESGATGLPVYDAKVEDVMEVIERLAADAALVEELSREAIRRSNEWSWTYLLPQWQRILYEW